MSSALVANVDYVVDLYSNRSGRRVETMFDTTSTLFFGLKRCKSRAVEPFSLRMVKGERTPLAQGKPSFAERRRLDGI
jgi:hypothetical protein